MRLVNGSCRGVAMCPPILRSLLSGLRARSWRVKSLPLETVKGRPYIQPRTFRQTQARSAASRHVWEAQMDNPLFGVPRSLRFAAGPAQFADGDGDGNGDDSSSGGQGSSGTTDVAPHLDPSSLVQEHGDARQALGALSQKVDSVESDNADLREERRELREKVPDDGSVVVSADTVEQLREDGFLDTDEPTEEDLVGALQEEREARVTLENKQRFEEVVNVTGANRGVLKDIGADTLNYEVEKETNDDGDTVKTAYVKTEDGRTEFTQFVKNEYPTLAETILDGDGGSSSSTTYPDQPGGGGDQGGGDDSPVTDTDSYIEKLNKERGRGDGDG